MAKVRTIKVSIERTVNLGNFENIKPSAEIVMELEDGDDVKEVYAEAFKIVSNEVNERVKKIQEFVNNKQG